MCLEGKKNSPREEWTIGGAPHHRRRGGLAVGVNRYSRDTTAEASKLEIGMRTHPLLPRLLLSLGNGAEREGIIRGGQVTPPASIHVRAHAAGCIIF